MEHSFRKHNLSVSHPLDSSPVRGALGKEVTLSANTFKSLWR